jgi:peptidoglycan-associated lipoprotein
MRKKLLVLLTVSALAGCASTGPEQEGAAVEERAAQPVETPPVAMVKPQEPAGAAFAALKDPKSILSKRSIYFDFDQFVIKDEFRPLVEAHAKFLVANPTMKILIQGNADERGSREYNLALGQKRAEALKKMLMLRGVKEEQVEAVSLGEEKPRAAGHDEAAWSENRRDDMLYSGEF